MFNRTVIVRTQTTQIWQCTDCSQNPVADSQDKQMAPLFDEKSLDVHQYQLRIHQGNANGIHVEITFLEVLLDATNMDVVCTQETEQQPKYKSPEFRNIRAVQPDGPVQGVARGGGGYDIHPITESLQNLPPTGQQLLHDEETDDCDYNTK